MAALSSCFVTMLTVFGNNLPSSRSDLNPSLVCNYNKLSSSRSAAISLMMSLKNNNQTKTKYSIETNASSYATPELEIIRHFHSSVWEGHDFTSSSTKDLIDQKRLNEFKKEVKTMLSSAAGDRFQELDLIDKIQRLGVAYHFKDEIEDILQQAFKDDFTHFFDQNIRKTEEYQHSPDHHLRYISLRFRLLRQAGLYVSTDVFKKFKNEKGEFHENIASDVQGILSLYEASYLGYRGEDIMDEAMVFSTKHLNSMLTSHHHHLSSSLALEVEHALKMPHQRIPERVYSRYYIPIYEQNTRSNQNQMLLEFAKLDYNFVQWIHQEELNEVQKWWKRIDLSSKIQCDFRSRVVEAYAINNNIYFEPEFCQGRIHVAKLWAILSFLDDAYDVFGNLDELELLCDAFQRWDANNTSKLSDRMRIVFHELLSFFNEIETDMIKGGNIGGVLYFKEAIQVHAKNLLEEAKVVQSGKLPRLEDWLSLSVPTANCGVFILLSSMNSLSSEVATKHVFDWIANIPKIITYSDLLARLTADIASLKVEQDRGTNCSSVPCYMIDHGVSESEANQNLKKIISSIWKVMNEECLRVHPVPMRVIKNTINYDRAVAFYYAGGDGHSVSDGRTKQIITQLFVNPIL